MKSWKHQKKVAKMLGIDIGKPWTKKELAEAKAGFIQDDLDTDQLVADLLSGKLVPIGGGIFEL